MGVTVTRTLSTESIVDNKINSHNNKNNVTLVNDMVSITTNNPRKVTINGDYCVPCDQLKAFDYTDQPELNILIKKYCNNSS